MTSQNFDLGFTIQTTFTFTIVTNAIPYEKVSKMLQFDTNIVGLEQKLKHLEHWEYRNAMKKSRFWLYWANPRESQIEILWNHRTWDIILRINYSEIKRSVFKQRQIKGYT